MVYGRIVRQTEVRAVQTKLTLRLDDRRIAFGKRWAASHGKSLSEVVADYLATIESLSVGEEDVPPLTRRLLGMAAGSEPEDYYRHLEAKYS
jgi:hypothetical protein